MSSDINWQEIVDDVFYNNYVKGNPSKFLNALEDVLKEKGYVKPINPKRPGQGGQGFGVKGFEDIINNFEAIKGLESDRNDRPLNRYIIQDVLVNKFFNGNEESAGKAYQEWIKSRGDYIKNTDSNGAEMNILKSIDDIPIWTPNDDVVSYMGDKFYFDYLFGGRFYESYKKQDNKRKEDEEYRKNRLLKKKDRKQQDVCNQCRSSDKMPYVSSDDDYPKGMIKKSEVCKRCSPDGEKPTKMFDPTQFGYSCQICKFLGISSVKDEFHFGYKDIIKNIQYWKDDLSFEEKAAGGRPVNGEKIEKAKKKIEEYENELYKPDQRCDCSFERLKDVYDRYIQFEDYKSLEYMKKNKLYNWFFEELSKTQNLNECIQRIKGIMKLL